MPVVAATGRYRAVASSRMRLRSSVCSARCWRRRDCRCRSTPCSWMSQAHPVGSTSAGKPTAALFSLARHAPAPSQKPNMPTPTALRRSGGLIYGIPQPGTSGLTLIPTSLPGCNEFKLCLATRSRLVFRSVWRNGYENGSTSARHDRRLLCRLPTGGVGDARIERAGRKSCRKAEMRGHMGTVFLDVVQRYQAFLGKPIILAETEEA